VPAEIKERATLVEEFVEWDAVGREVSVY